MTTKTYNIGDWITDGLVRGQVIRIGVMGKRIPAYLVNIGGGRTTLIPTSIAEPFIKPVTSKEVLNGNTTEAG